MLLDAAPLDAVVQMQVRRERPVDDERAPITSYNITSKPQMKERNSCSFAATGAATAAATAAAGTATALSQNALSQNGLSQNGYTVGKGWSG